MREYERIFLCRGALYVSIERSFVLYLVEEKGTVDGQTVISIRQSKGMEWLARRRREVLGEVEIQIDDRLTGRIDPKMELGGIPHYDRTCHDMKKGRLRTNAKRFPTGKNPFLADRAAVVEGDFIPL